MLVREVREEDLVLVGNLLNELDPGAPLLQPKAIHIWRIMAQYPFYKTFVAVDPSAAGAAVVGTFTLLIGDNLGHGGTPFAIMENMVTHPACRGQGVGRLMMREAMRMAREHGCYKLMLSSDSKREAAHHFYDSMGLARHGISFRVEFDS